MLDVFRGHRPDITPAQVAAVLVAGVPVIAALLSAFGIADLAKEQQDALTGALTWGGVLAGLLVGGDAALRGARNAADARRDAAAMTAGTAAAALQPSGDLQDPEVDRIEQDVVTAGEGDAPDDDEPDASPTNGSLAALPS